MNRRELLQLSLSSALVSSKPASAQTTQRNPIRTGVEPFDNLTGGLPTASLTVLYGHNKGGKTTLAINVAEHVAVEQKRPVLYLVQSFSAQTLTGQIASSRAHVDWLDVAEGKLSAEDVERFQTGRCGVSPLEGVAKDALCG
jgi:replicative DNA helicase